MAKKILIIEDNEKNRLLISDILKFHGYEILESKDGEKGIKMAGENKPDLILLDIQMPVMNGFSVVKELKNRPELRTIKIIAVTSFAMKGDREKILQMGADDYISKPIDTRQLPELVKKYIGGA
ncbi:MAG: response regulator [bacterium]